LVTSDRDSPPTEDIDIRALGRALWRAKGWILGLAIGAGVVTFIGLSMLRPLYTSEARILVQNEEPPFTRPAGEEGRSPQQPALDEQAVQSQVQVLTSRDLAVEVIEALDLTNNAAFAKDGGLTIVGRLLRSLGIGRGSAMSELEKAANTFADHLSVYQLAKSSVVAVDYTSGDSGLAADVANKLADVYIEWQRKAKLDQTKDATAWLSAQIETLRPKVAEAEAAVEQFKASQGLFAGTNNVTLNAQQLSELNSQVILAKAQKSEAEARARLIKKTLAEGGDIDAMPEVLKSELIGRLIDQRVQVQRQLAELSATLLPSHPRIKQLNSELADVTAQIRDEATKIVKSLENEAEVAGARETSLRNSLNEAKRQASGSSEAEIKLRALEREAKAQRDLLESYLARYRDASARHDMGAVPARAAIVSRAHASILPSFPKRGPISVLVAVATALLALSYVLARELIGAPAPARRPMEGSEPRMRKRRHAPPPVEPAGTPAAATAAPSPTPPQRPALLPSRRRDDVKESATPKAAPFLPAQTLPRTEVAQAAPPPLAETGADAPSEPSAAGLINRLRRDLSQSPSEPQEPAPEPQAGWFARRRTNKPIDRETEAVAETAAAMPQGANMPARTNDLRAYLNQRLAARTEAANDSVPTSVPAQAKSDDANVGPILKSLNAVINHILASGRGGAPRAVLVAGAKPKVDATAETIGIARALVARREQIVLVDLARGPAAISGPLGLPRAPGLTDLVAGRAGFEDVVRIDKETPLQVITAGNPKLTAPGDETDRFARVFEALTHTYDCVVLNADPEAVRQFTPALKFELPVVVAVLLAGASAKGERADLAGFSALGCPVLAYEQSGKEPRSRLLGRAAAI
jgi:uncharacterized protein involved in exopolysaccharide biosynthesis/Mrp family chromosome partitioning ATPase